MRIWLVQRSESTPHDDLGNSRIMRTGMIARALTERGHTVVWWTSTFNHFKHCHRYKTDTRVEVSNNYHIQYVRGFGYQKNLSISRIIDNILIARRFKLLAYKDTDKPDIILASVPTIELAREAVQYGLKFGIPVVLDIRDLWPDVIYDFFPTYFRSLLSLAFIPMVWQLKQACSHATAIIGLTDAFVDWGIAHADRSRNTNDRVFRMGYWSEKELTEKQEEFSYNFWQSQGIEKNDDCLLVIFLGTLGQSFDLIPIIEAGKILQEKKSNAKFIICGSGVKLTFWQNQAANLSNIHFTGWIDKHEIITLLKIADIGLAPYINSINYADTPGNKPGEYMSGGLAIALSLDNGSLYDIIHEYECGFSYHNSPELLASELDQLSKNRERLETMKQNSIATFKNLFDAKVVYNELAEYLESLVLSEN